MIAELQTLMTDDILNPLCFCAASFLPVLYFSTNIRPILLRTQRVTLCSDEPSLERVRHALYASLSAKFPFTPTV